MTKLLLVDCDGTIREPLSGAKFISHPRDQRIMAGADKAIAHYHKQGWTIVGISNQAGIAAGYKSIEDAIAEQQYTLSLFPEMTAIFFCPDFEGQHCCLVGIVEKPRAIHLADWAADLIGTFRKPDPGMINAALRMTNILLAARHESWFVGARAEDEQAAAAAGINYLDAAIWRSRFLPGVHEMPPLTKEQIEFLEGVKL